MQFRAFSLGQWGNLKPKLPVRGVSCLTATGLPYSPSPQSVAGSSLEEMWWIHNAAVRAVRIMLGDLRCTFSWLPQTPSVLYKNLVLFIHWFMTHRGHKQSTMWCLHSSNWPQFEWVITNNFLEIRNRNRFPDSWGRSSRCGFIILFEMIFQVLR